MDPIDSLRRRWLGRAATLLLGSSVAVAAREQTAASSRRSLSFGVVPQQAVGALAVAWIPLLDRLAAAAGVDLRFATAPDIPTFEDRLLAGDYDLAYMNPYHYALFSRQPGYRAFAHERGRRLLGVLVVRDDSGAARLADLAGSEIAYPAPGSFAATLLIRAEFARLSIATLPRYVGSHESVYLNVLRGLFPAGGGIPRTLDALEPASRRHLRVLWSSRSYTPHAFAAHPRVPAATVAALREAMRNADHDPPGKAALDAAGIDGLQPAEDAEWDDVRALDFGPLTRPAHP